MLSGESLRTVLLSLATGQPEHAVGLVASSDVLTAEERAALTDPMRADVSPAARARGLGDALRALAAPAELANECYRVAFYLGDGLGDVLGDPFFAWFSAHRADRPLARWVHTFPTCSSLLAPYRSRPVRLLHVDLGPDGGVGAGALDLWSWYFESATITAIGAADSDRGDGGGAAALTERIAALAGPFEVVIAEGGRGRDQPTVLDALVPLLAEGGILLLLAAPCPGRGATAAGEADSGTPLGEWLGARVDDINGFHRLDRIDPLWTEQVAAVHCYDALVAIERKRRFAPFVERTGGAELLVGSAATTGVVSDLLRARDSAIRERDAALRERDAARLDGVGPGAPSSDEELRLLRGELARLRPHTVELERRLEQAEADRDQARESLRHVRRSRRGRAFDRLRRGGR